MGRTTGGSNVTVSVAARNKIPPMALLTNPTTDLRPDHEDEDGPDDRLEQRERLEFLSEELGRAVGLGGRARPQGSPAERARVNVTKLVKKALARIDAEAPELGSHLRRTVRTGAICCYAPDPRAPIRWEV